MPAPAVGTGSGSAAAFDASSGWQVHPQVSIRHEPFGALLYHFGTRKLSFLKNRVIVTVIESLADHPDADAALRAAGVAENDRAPYLHALGVLASSNMLVPNNIEDGM